MFEIYVKKRFDAAHFLPESDGKCANMHGHSWKVEAAIKSKNLEKGMVIDFDKVKKILDDVIPDHCLLNDILENPTAENLAELFYGKLKDKIPGLYKVTVWESSSSGASYFED